MAKRLLALIMLSITLVLADEGFNNDWLNPKLVPLEVKIGQMLLVGFSGDQYNQEVEKFIKDYHVGGVILFSKALPKDRQSNITSPTQLKALTTQLQANANIKLFVSVDMEGGRVARLNSENGFKDFKSAKQLAQLGEEDVYQEAVSIGKMLHDLNINFNFAPVVDVDVNLENPIIAKLERSFSPDYETVIKFAKATINGLHESNIITSIKHFPGHGSSQGDSHEGFVDITKTYNDVELKVYENIIKDGYNDAIMTAHVFNGNIDSRYPASLSKIFITDILRNQLNYNGLVITDDLKMGAISNLWSLHETLILAINAGADIMLYGNNLGDYNKTFVEDATKIINDALKSGAISETQIDNAYLRIIKLKQKYLYEVQ